MQGNLDGALLFGPWERIERATLVGKLVGHWIDRYGAREVRRWFFEVWLTGIGEGGDCPPFAGMHEASAAVAGGSLRAMEAILRGDVEHAFHPGGGLHRLGDGGVAAGLRIDAAGELRRAVRDLRVQVEGGDDDHRHRRQPGILLHLLQEAETVEPGHLDVEEDDIGVPGFQDLQRLPAQRVLANALGNSPSTTMTSASFRTLMTSCISR